MLTTVLVDGVGLASTTNLHVIPKDPPFTIDQLVNKLELRSKGEITTNQLDVLVKDQGMSFEWNFDTWQSAATKYNPSQLSALNELVRRLQAQNTSMIPPERTSTATKLVDPHDAESNPTKQRDKLQDQNNKDPQRENVTPTEDSGISTKTNANQALHASKNESKSFFANEPLYFIAGAKFQNPYAIGYDKTSNPDFGTINDNGNSTVSFIAVSYVSRFSLIGSEGETARRPKLYPFKYAPDFDASIGFVFGNELAPTNYSASTIAGGGDFFATVNLGFPLWRYPEDNQSTSRRHQLTLELGGGVTTEKDFKQAHSSGFFGLGYQLGYRAFYLGSDDGEQPFGVMALKAGVGVVDVPEIRVNGTELQVPAEGGLPQFDYEWAPSVGVTIFHPVTRNLYLFVGANIYLLREAYSPSTGPDQWSITVGATIPMDTISGAIQGAAGGFSTKKP